MDFEIHNLYSRKWVCLTEFLLMEFLLIEFCKAINHNSKKFFVDKIYYDF